MWSSLISRHSHSSWIMTDGTVFFRWTVSLTQFDLFDAAAAAATTVGVMRVRLGSVGIIAAASGRDIFLVLLVVAAFVMIVVVIVMVVIVVMVIVVILFVVVVIVVVRINLNGFAQVDGQGGQVFGDELLDHNGRDQRGRRGGHFFLEPPLTSFLLTGHFDHYGDGDEDFLWPPHFHYGVLHLDFRLEQSRQNLFREQQIKRQENHVQLLRGSHFSHVHMCKNYYSIYNYKITIASI